MSLLRRPGAGIAIATAILLAGAACAAEDTTAGPSATASAPARDPAGARVGPAGSPCELPVSFQLAEKWEAAAVEADPDDVFGDIVRRGSLELVCEIKAKPAGHVAFIRVWVDPDATDARRALEAYLREEDSRKPAWSDLTLGDTPGVEVLYGNYSELLEETRTLRAFAARTPKGGVVVTLGGVEAEDEAVVAAYELAKKTFAVNF